MEAAISLFQSENFLNGIFVVMITFVVLCHVYPQFIARLQSNPYTIQLQWNFGVESFNFQLLNYDIYHASNLSRWCHHLTIIFEAVLWMIIIRWSCGFYFSMFALSVLILQSLSFRDHKFAAVMASLWITMACASEIILTTTDIDVYHFKLLILFSVMIRTLSHVLELVPPLVNGDHDKFSKEIALWFAFSDPWPSTIAWVFGNLSEMASALPGRLFPVVVYLAMTHLGYQSAILDSVPQTEQLSSQIVKSGWSSYHLTARLFSWAIPQSTPKVMASNKKVDPPHA